MAIADINGLIAGFQPPQYFHKGPGAPAAGRPETFWAAAGIPGAGSYDTTLNGVTLSSTSALVNGQIPFFDPGSGNSYLARFTAGGVGAGKTQLCDRLWHNGGYSATSTGVQSSTTPTWPARDNNGSTNGDGVLIGLEVSGTVGAGTPTIAVSYTNSVGTASRTANLSRVWISASGASSFYPFTLQPGDIGVRSVQSLQLSATLTSGTINLVAYRVIATLDLCPNFLGTVDPLTGGLPQMFNGSVPYIVIFPSAGAITGNCGTMTVVRG